MKPIGFKEQNTVFAVDQPQYLPLPAHRDEGRQGRVTSCWQLSWKERWRVLFNGRLWLTQFTFHDPLQPQRPSVDKPAGMLRSVAAAKASDDHKAA